MEYEKYEKYYADNLDKCMQIINKKNSEIVKADDINSISIHGDRGFGKTTFLNLLRTRLLETEGIVVSEIIDPINLLKSNNNSIEYTYRLVEVLLYTYYDLNYCHYNSNQTEIIKKISSIIEKKNGIKKDGNSEIGSGLSLLSTLEDNFSIKHELNELFKDIKVVLILDDLDMLESKVIKKITDELHDFIGVKNVYFITAYKERQLYNALLSSELEETKLVYEDNSISKEEIHERVSNKMMKMYPFEYMVKLPTINQFYESVYDESGSDGKSKKEYVINKLNNLFDTKIVPFSPDESINFLLPATPRSYNQFLEVIKYLESIDKVTDLKDYTKSQKKNQYFSEYLHSKVQESDFPIKYKQLVTSYKVSEYEQKNWCIVGGIREIVSERISGQINDKIQNNVCFITEERDAVNSSISDVIKTLNDFKDLSLNRLDIEFVYLLKLLISLDNAILINKFQEALDGNEDVSNNMSFSKVYENYSSVINGNVLPYDYNQFGVESYPRISLKHIQNENNEYDPLERALALYTLVSVHEAGSIFIDNSGFAKYMNNHLSNNTKSRNKKDLFKDSTSNARRWKFVKLNNKGAEYDNYKLKSIESEYDFVKVINAAREENGSLYLAASKDLVYDPLLFFTKKELIGEILNSSNGEKWKKLIIGNVFLLEEVTDFNTFRPGEKYPVTRVLRRYLTMFKYYKKIDDVNEDIDFITRVVRTEHLATDETKNIVSDAPVEVSAKNRQMIVDKIATLKTDDKDEYVREIVKYLTSLNSTILTQKLIGEEATGLIKNYYKEKVSDKSKRYYISTMVKEIAEQFEVAED